MRLFKNLFVLHLAIASWFIVLEAKGSDAKSDEPHDIRWSMVGAEYRTLSAQAGEGRCLTWWLPDNPDSLVLPISGGVLLDTSDERQMRWFKTGAPWSLSELPALGIRYGERMLVVLIPWPHYAQLVTDGRIGIRFTFPEGRNNSTPCAVIVQERGADPMEVAHAFREWRRSSADRGAIPKPRSLEEKARDLSNVKSLYGAPHIYLWGPALFSFHDVDASRWRGFSNELLRSTADSLPGRLLAEFSPEEKASLGQLSAADFPANYLTRVVASAINRALASPRLLDLPETSDRAEVIVRNREAFAKAMEPWTHAPDTWGDGLSLPMLTSLHKEGIARALLLMSDFYGYAPKPEVAAAAEEIGYLLGPYDGYHDVHDPKALPDETWETARFDNAAYVEGRVVDFDGRGNVGFQNRGYHFSPLAAHPYVRARVQSTLARIPFKAWFIDCDATAECFDDYNPAHPATRVDDINARRERLRWLGQEKELVVGSEGGSVLFSDLVSFGHGVQTPYIGHRTPEFGDVQSPSFLGKYWPADCPEYFFKPASVPASLQIPYFDPRTRIPLYRAALGDEIIVTHHWCYDAFKFENEAIDRELMDLLYMVPPLYHLNRQTWPLRRERILRHLQFWSPLHEKLAPAQLIRFEWLTPDRLVQRTTFRIDTGEVSMTVNFGSEIAAGYPPRSATVEGPIQVALRTYQLFD